MRTLALVGLFFLAIHSSLSAQEMPQPTEVSPNSEAVVQETAPEGAPVAEPVEMIAETPKVEDEPVVAEPETPVVEEEAAEVRETAPVKTIRPHKIPKGEVELAQGLVLEYGGFYRQWIKFMDEFPVDEDRNTAGQSLWGEHQFRVNPGIRFENIQLKIKSQFDIFRGQLWGDTARFKHPDALRRRDRHDGADITKFDFRQLYLEWMSPVGLLRGGQMASNWGLGLVANDGEPDDDRFGQKYHGDLSERLMFVTAPFSLATDAKWAKELLVAVGADLTYRDENAELLDGDMAWGAVASMVYFSEKYKGGGYFAYRNQEDDDGDTLEAYVVDFYGDFKIDLGSPAYQLLVAFESVYMMAHTDRVTNYEAPDGIDVKAFGAVGRLGMDFTELGIVPMFEVGYASGDKNSYDETNYAFSFDPDYNVGMILFDEVMEAVSARGASLVYDPERQQHSPERHRAVVVPRARAECVLRVSDPQNQASEMGYDLQTRFVVCSCGGGIPGSLADLRERRLADLLPGER